MKRYICLDIEMSEVSSKQRKFLSGFRTEIIQVGAIMLDENFKVIGKFSNYVKPMYSHITETIEKLTGIKEENIENADSLITVMDKLLYWIGDNDITTFCWSACDYNQICMEILLKSEQRNDILEFLKTFVDLQKTFSELLSAKKRISLESAIILIRERFIGQQHTAYSDAYNTACILYKICNAKGLKPKFEYLYLNADPKMGLDQIRCLKKHKERIIPYYEYKTKIYNFVDKELLEQWGLLDKYHEEGKNIKNKNNVQKKLEKTNNSQRKIIKEQPNERNSKKKIKDTFEIKFVEKIISKVNKKTVFCEKYGIPLKTFIYFSIRMQFTGSLNMIIN